MKQGTECVESEVAEILLKLQTLIREFQCGILPPWGRKRKRSAITVSPKAHAPSPATPLSFSPSESDDNPTTLFRRNVSLKKKKEHYEKIIEELTKDNDLLNGEIKNVKCYFDKLKDFNLRLKARKQELSLGPNQGDPVRDQLQLQFPSMAHHQPLIVNHTAGPSQIRDDCARATTSFGVSSFNGGALGMGMGITNSNNVGPMEIPDLNLPLDESMALECCEALDMNMNVVSKDLSKAMAAQARQNRLLIYRLKNPIGNTKSRYSCR